MKNNSVERVAREVDVNGLPSNKDIEELLPEFYRTSYSEGNNITDGDNLIHPRGISMGEGCFRVKGIFYE